MHDDHGCIEFDIMLFIELWQFVRVEKIKRKNLRHILRKRTTRQRERESERDKRQGKQKFTEKRSLFNALDRLKKMLNTVKTLLLLVRAVRFAFLVCTLDVCSLLLVFLFIVCLPFFEPPCVRARLFRARDCARAICSSTSFCFLIFLMIMMRQLFKSRHIHALVKRPRRTCIMIVTTNDISSWSRSFDCSFSFALVCLLFSKETERELKKKNAHREKKT